MEMQQSYHDNRKPPEYDVHYETFHGRPYRVDTALYRRELYLPKLANSGSSHNSVMEHHPQQNALRDEKKESKSFKTLVTNFMGYTSAHGIGRLVDSKTIFWKIFWSLVCMGALSMFIYQGTGLLKQFLSKPVATSVSITFEKRLPFPAVTVCNMNMIRKAAMPPEVQKELKNKLDYSWSAVDTEADSDSRRRRATGSGDLNNGTQSGSSGGSTRGGPTPGGSSDDIRGESDDGSQDGLGSGGYDQGYDETYRNDDDYADYYNDLNEVGSGEDYDEDENEEFPDVDSISVETRLRLQIANTIGGLDEYSLYDRGHQFETLIRNCTWKGIDCKTGNLSKFWTNRWNYKYGNCFTFNLGVDPEGKSMRVLKATKPGPSQGLLLEMNVEQEQYIGPLSVEAGVRILLSGQRDMTFPYEQGFSVSPGVSTSVGIKKTQITRLDRFNNKSCLPQNELPLTNIYRRYRNITTYSQHACLNSCLGLSQRIRCKCSENQFPSDRPPCDVFNKVTSKCLKIVKHLFNDEKLSCLADCRQPCEEEVILKTISSSQWPSQAYKNYLISQNKYANESDNLLQVNVFFNELNYEKIEEAYSYGTINLLADIGGQLGLWIGISVITVFEVIELIIMFFTVCVKKFNAASEVHEVPAYR